jgi:hypothetical protein
MTDESVSFLECLLLIIKPTASKGILDDKGQTEGTT